MNMITMLLIVISSVIEVTAAEPPSRNIIKLSHPFNKLNSTSYTRFIDARHASQRRFNLIQARTDQNLIGANGTEIGLLPYKGLGFRASVGIGTPPVEQLLEIDTGSALTWTQCKGCDPCKAQQKQNYDPANSFVYLTCDDPRCDSVPENGCSSSNTDCNYEMKYGDNSESTGNAGLETFTFTASNASDIVMGCGLRTIGFDDNEISGILGLGSGIESIATKLGPQFSYCIGSLNYTNPGYHFLILGKGAIMAGEPSPMMIENEFYYVSLEGIKVGDVTLDIDPEVFKMTPDKRGGVIIDSGTVMTFLIRPAYRELRAEIVRLLHNFTIVQVPAYPDDLCFKGSFDDAYVPPVDLKFANGRTISIVMSSLFRQTDLGFFCMMIAENFSSTSIIGTYAQQYHNIGYDVPGKNIYFYRTDCLRAKVM